LKGLGALFGGDKPTNDLVATGLLRVRGRIWTVSFGVT